MQEGRARELWNGFKSRGYAELGRLYTDVVDSVGDVYQQIILGYPRFPQHHYSDAEVAKKPLVGPPERVADRGLDGEILPPENPVVVAEGCDRTPADILAELRATRIERSDPAEPKLLPGRDPERGMDLDR